MMAVLAGRIKISAPAQSGREVVLAIIDAGEVFGEIALLDGDPRTADATALSDCDLLVIDRRDFIPFLERRSDLCMRLLKLLSQRLRQTAGHKARKGIDETGQQCVDPCSRRSRAA
jgi:CRP-like cAMP-binding protein